MRRGQIGAACGEPKGYTGTWGSRPQGIQSLTPYPKRVVYKQIRGHSAYGQDAEHGTKNPHIHGLPSIRMMLLPDPSEVRLTALSMRFISIRESMELSSFSVPMGVHQAGSLSLLVRSHRYRGEF